MATRGAFYVACGDEWVHEAITSAHSLKEYMPGLPILLYSDRATGESIFDEVRHVELPAGDRRIEATYARIELMAETPWDWTLRLDTDTLVLDDLSPVFELLSHFDLVSAHASTRFTIPLDDVPPTFPEYHAGVVAYNSSGVVYQFIRSWAAKYRQQVAWAEGEGRGRLLDRICPYHADQSAMRWALYYSDLRIATLTPEWDCCPYAGFAQGKVRLIHDRGARLERARESLNQESGSRVYVDGKIIGLP